MRPAAESRILAVQPDQLRKPQARLHGEQQQCVIAPSEPGRLVGTSEDSIDLDAGQEMQLALVASLRWYRQHTLNMGAVRRRLERGVAKERPDRRQTEVASSRRRRPTHLQIVQKRTYEGRVEIRQAEL